MTQKISLLILVFCVVPIEICASNSKPFNSLQVAGPAIVTGLASVNALNVKNGADFGGDVAVDGMLFVDGGMVLDSCLVLTCTTAGQLLVNGLPVVTGSAAFSGVSLIPFSSGVINNGVFTSGSILMGFGNYVQDNSGDAARTALAFTVPTEGKLYDLNVSVDGYYTSTAAGSLTFDFTLLVSHCDNGSLPSYSSSSLSASATLTPVVTLSFGQGFTGCGTNNVYSLAVAAGDRVVLQVTSTSPGIDCFFGENECVNPLGFSAGVLYSPTS